MTNPSVSLCFPAYNEEKTIAAVLLEARDLLKEADFDYEVIVCDDASTDKTGSIIDATRDDFPQLKVIHHTQNKGIRFTFEELYASAEKEFVFLNSTDGQWDTAVLLGMLPLTWDWDIIIASRKKKPYGPLRSIISWGFNLAPFLLFGVQTFDAGAVKLTRRELISRFRIISKSPFNEAERLIRASKAGYRITTYPVEVASRRSGHAHGVKMKLVLQSILDMGLVWWDLNIVHRNELNSRNT